MLKSVQIAGYPKEYYDLFHEFADGRGTFRKYLNKIEQLSRALKFTDEEDSYKFKGDMLEVLSEIFFNVFFADESLGITDYTPVPLDNDYGVDALGVNPNGHKVAIQVKYRNNPKDLVLYAEIARTYTAGILIHELDLQYPKTVYVFTSANDVTAACKTVLGDKLVIVSRDMISRRIDNNETFWKYAFSKIFEYLDSN